MCDGRLRHVVTLISRDVMTPVFVLPCGTGGLRRAWPRRASRLPILSLANLADHMGQAVLPVPAPLRLQRVAGAAGRPVAAARGRELLSRQAAAENFQPPAFAAAPKVFLVAGAGQDPAQDRFRCRAGIAGEGAFAALSAEMGLPDLVQLFLQSGAVDSEAGGQTARSLAQRQGHADIVAAIDAGAGRAPAV